MSRAAGSASRRTPKTSPSKKGGRLLEKKHIEALALARALIAEYEREASAQPGYEFGKFSEACKAADQALYNVLMIARAWLKNDSITDKHLFPD